MSKSYLRKLRRNATHLSTGFEQKGMEELSITGNKKCLYCKKAIGVIFCRESRLEYSLENRRREEDFF
jgi:hypothetical protein